MVFRTAGGAERPPVGLPATGPRSPGWGVEQPVSEYDNVTIMHLRFGRLSRLGGGLALVVAGLSLIGSAGVSAFAAGGSTTANAAVNQSITLSGLTASFTITGNPSTTATSASAVSYNVTTNDRNGYTVTAQAAAATMAGAAVGNTDTIPIADLSAKDSAAATYSALSNTAALTLESTSAKTSNTGDNLTNGYQLAIPFVNADTYSVTINYTATGK